MKNTKVSRRIWELDFFRGIALVLMIYFHVIFDLNEIYKINIHYTTGINYYIGKLSVITFILISGISCSLSKNNLKRGVRIFVLGMAVSLTTFIYNNNLLVKFGILHFLGISIILIHFLSKANKYILLTSGILIILIGKYFSGINASNDLLFPFGVTSSTFISSDYYPLFPWFGIFLFGTVMGKTYYTGNRSIFPFTINFKPLIYLGRNSLIIYLLHQPLIFLVLKLIF